MSHDLMRGQIGSYAYMQTRTVKKRPKKHIDTKQKNQNRPTISCFTLKMYYFCNNLLDQSQKEIDKVFLVKPQTNLVKTWLGEGMG